MVPLALNLQSHDDVDWREMGFANSLKVPRGRSMPIFAASSKPVASPVKVGVEVVKSEPVIRKHIKSFGDYGEGMDKILGKKKKQETTIEPPIFQERRLR